MTQKRRDNASTEFGLWLRYQNEIDSKLGFVTSNIDYVWRNYKTKEYMLIEEKRFGWFPRFYQIKTYGLIDEPHRGKNNYRGFHILIFEMTNPEDGRVWLDGKIISRDQLIQWLCFKAPPDWYTTYLPKTQITKIKFTEVDNGN